MDGCTAINFVKHVKIVFVQVGVCAALWHLRELSQHSNNQASALHRVLQLKIWTKTVLTCITKIIAEQPSLTQYERPMDHGRKINRPSSTDNNFMIFLFDFLEIKDLILAPFFFFYSHCILHDWFMYYQSWNKLYQSSGGPLGTNALLVRPLWTTGSPFIMCSEHSKNYHN